MFRKVEFVVDDIKPIVWNPSSFDSLRFLGPRKVSSLPWQRPIWPEDRTIRSRILWREKVKASLRFCSMQPNVWVLGLQLICTFSGSFGVGKTLTAEALSEYLERPLYVVSRAFPLVTLASLTFQVSAGELGQEATKLEDQLSRVSQVAHHWKAFVLLDEADVFVQARSFNNQHNTLVSVSLRKLEYFRGILFLTSNRVQHIDDAIQSRLLVALHYGPLGLDTRKTIWASFLKKGAAKYTPQDLDWLAQREVSGRQVCLRSMHVCGWVC